MRPLAFAVLLIGGAAQAQEAGGRGKVLYDKWCAGCHGETGRGDGPAAAYMLPRPRDFTSALYQVRTTASGQIPTDDDMMRVIEVGMPGTAMPGWSSQISAGDRRELVTHLKSFSRFFTGPAPELVEPAGAPRASAEGLEEGRQLYQRLECWKCHGNAGRADGPSAPTLRDRGELPIPPANLTQNWRFNGGGEVEDIYLRLLTGLDGTPMPTSKDLLDSRVIAAEQLWRVAQFVRSLSPDQPPPVREIVRARRVDGQLPANPDDSVWARTDEFYVPLVGQIIKAPRWFAPRVDGVFVRALYDGERVAVRLRWSDPSQSPDPAWAEWRGAMARTMTGADGALDSLPRPDGVMVQFPRAIPDDGTRPYFLMGEPNNPVYAWRWQSTPRVAEAGRATGLGTFAALPGADETPVAEAVFDNGEWRLVLTRARSTPDSANALQFASGRPIPIALFAWDGDNGEGDTRIAISTWYFLVLEEPTPPSAYATPIVAAMLTLVLGWVVIWRAQAGGRRKQS
jgi:DMSO reductase family type II enzyme heme b subunit